MSVLYLSLFFFFNDTATTEIYTLSLHDALPISQRRDHRHQRVQPLVPELAVDVDGRGDADHLLGREVDHDPPLQPLLDRKSTRLNSSHANISYAVFCLKKKKKTTNLRTYI